MNNYLILKALHLIAVMAWMAALLYLPRLYVYHSDVAIHSEASNLFKTMEKRLTLFIMRPAMVLSLVMGVALIVSSGMDIKQATWFHGKAFLVMGLIGFHGFLEKCLKDFKQDKRPYSATFFRVMNECPTFLMIGIIFFVVLKPF